MENDFSTESSQAISVGNTTSAPVKKKFSFGNVALLLAIAIVIIIVGALFGPKLLAKTQIVGTWSDYSYDSDTGGIETKLKFDNDGSFTYSVSSTRYSALSFTDKGSYSVGLDGKLTLNADGYSSSFHNLTLEYDSNKKGVGGYWCINGSQLYLGSLSFVKK